MVQSSSRPTTGPRSRTPRSSRNNPPRSSSSNQLPSLNRSLSLTQSSSSADTDSDRSTSNTSLSFFPRTRIPSPVNTGSDNTYCSPRTFRFSNGSLPPSQNDQSSASARSPNEASAENARGDQSEGASVSEGEEITPVGDKEAQVKAIREKCEDIEDMIEQALQSRDQEIIMLKRDNEALRNQNEANQEESKQLQRETENLQKRVSYSGDSLVGKYSLSDRYPSSNKNVQN